MLNCIIIDDEADNIEKLQGFIQQHGGLQLEFSTTDPIKGMDYIKAHDPDLIFLDIQMDELSGVELAKVIKDKKKIVFTTASDKYTLGAFEEGVLDYILKPFGYGRFENAVQKALDYQKIRQETTVEATPSPVKVSGDLFLKGENKSKLTRLRLEDIYYIQGMGNYAGFCTKNELLLALITFKELEERLPHPAFIRIHKSYIIAYDSVVAVDGNEVTIRTDKKDVQIPIGAMYREQFLTLIQRK